jgi:magnesium-transporting ATPase (P-type)
MNAKFFIAWVVILVLWMAGGFIVHGTLLKPDYDATNLMRPDAEQQQYFIWMIIAHVIMSGAFVWIYARGKEAKAWLGQGLRFGLAVALLAVVPLYLIYYTVQPLPGMLVVKQIVFDTIVTLILGAVVAFLYRDKAAA